MINIIVVGCLLLLVIITIDSWLDEEVWILEKVWWTVATVVVTFYAIYSFVKEGIL